MALPGRSTAFGSVQALTAALHPACPAVAARELLPELLQQVAVHCTLREKWERNLAQGVPPLPPPLVESRVWGEPKGLK